MTSTTASSNIIVNSVASSNAHSFSSSSHPPQLAQLQQHTPHLPQVTQIQTIPAVQPHSQANNVQASSTANVTSTANTNSTTTSTAAQGNTKEKCRKFLANLIELSTREPKPVEKNVRTLIQELVNANVEPEEFCDRLERLLNASPQPCLIGFLKVCNQVNQFDSLRLLICCTFYRKVCHCCARRSTPRNWSLRASNRLRNKCWDWLDFRRSFR